MGTLGNYNLISGKETEFNSYLEHIEADLHNHKKHNKISIEKLASTYGITNKNLVKETTEFAIVKIARSLAHQKSKTAFEKYIDIVDLYYNQVNLSHRTSQSMLLQQYSTPAPISYIAGLYVLDDSVLGSVKRGGRFTKNHFNFKSEVKDSFIKKRKYFEPSAGNGLLTIALPMQDTIVNEVDDVRLRNLQTQDFEFVSNQDALMPFPDYYKKFDGVVTNPPFATLPDAVIYDGFRIKHLDHVMSLRALDTMKDNGKAAIIIGGHTAWDDKGRVQSGKNRIFLNYLYSHYYVEDVIHINGHKLYSRQGTAFNTRLILIDGRKEKKEGFAPLKTEEAATEMKDFEDLWLRVFDFGKKSNKKTNKTLKKTKQKVSDFEKEENGKPKIKKRWEQTSDELIKSTLFDLKYAKFFDSAKWYRENIETPVTDSRTGKIYNHFTLYKVTPKMLKEHGKEAHYNLIKKALQDGKSIPEKVLAEYPDLSIPKEIWQMSEQEYRKIRNPKNYIQETSVASDYDFAIRNAISENKDVSKEVLKWYKKRHPTDAQRKKEEKKVNEFIQDIFNSEGKQKRIRIVKAKAQAKLKLLNLVSLDGVQTNILSVENEYLNVSSNQIQVIAEKFYAKNIQGKKIFNLDQNIEIVFTGKGKKKTTRGRHVQKRFLSIDSVLATAVNHLIYLTENAKFSGCNTRLKQTHKKIGGVKWWNFYSKIFIDNELYYLSIPVLEVSKGNSQYKFQYSLEYADIKKILTQGRPL